MAKGHQINMDNREEEKEVVNIGYKKYFKAFCKVCDRENIRGFSTLPEREVSDYLYKKTVDSLEEQYQKSKIVIDQEEIKKIKTDPINIYLEKLDTQAFRIHQDFDIWCDSNERSTDTYNYLNKRYRNICKKIYSAKRIKKKIYNL